MILEAASGHCSKPTYLCAVSVKVSGYTRSVALGWFPHEGVFQCWPVAGSGGGGGATLLELQEALGQPWARVPAEDHERALLA
jgi:hypothetical protein